MLSKRAREVLKMLNDDQFEELVQEGKEVWIGLKRTHPRIVLELLLFCAISATSNPRDAVQRYTINQTGREILKGDFSAVIKVWRSGLKY